MSEILRKRTLITTLTYRKEILDFGNLFLYK